MPMTLEARIAEALPAEFRSQLTELAKEWVRTLREPQVEMRETIDVIKATRHTMSMPAGHRAKTSQRKSSSPVVAATRKEVDEDEAKFFDKVRAQAALDASDKCEAAAIAELDATAAANVRLLQQSADSVQHNGEREASAHRAKAEMPGGKTIAHGLLSLSLTPMFIRSVMGLKGLKNTLNYGADRIRYLSPVPAGSKLRGRVSIAEAEDVPPNGLRVHYREP